MPLERIHRLAARRLVAMMTYAARAPGERCFAVEWTPRSLWREGDSLWAAGAISPLSSEYSLYIV